MVKSVSSGDNGEKSSKAEPDRDTAARIKALRERLRGRKSEHTEPHGWPGEIFPVSRAQRQAQLAEDEKLFRIGVGGLYPGKGIYLGRWQMPETKNALSKSFNLFAAPEDLPLLGNFNKVVKAMTELKDWHGYDGFDQDKVVKNPEQVLLEALASGSYKGEWFIPPLPILTVYLYSNRDKGLFKNGLKRERNEKDHGHWYWSCSPSNETAHFISNQSFFSGQVTADNRHSFKMSVRPVRAELRL